MTYSLCNNITIRARVIPNLIASLFLVLICVVPILDRDLPQVIKLMAFFLWSFTALFLGDVKKNRIGWGVIAGWSIYIALQFLYSLIGYSRELTFFMARYYVYVIPVVMVYVTSLYNVKELKVLWNFTIFIFVICLIHNFFLGAHGDDDVFDLTSETKGSNAGGTAFVSGCMFILPSLWLIFRNTNKIVYKLVSLAIIIGCTVYMFFYNSRATIVVIFVLMFIGLLMADRIKNISSRKIILWLFLLVLLTFLFAAPFFSFLADLWGDVSRMSDRMEDLAFVAGGGDVSSIGHGSLFYRYLLWQASINTFLGGIINFFVGIGEQEVDGDLQSLIKAGVGNHSEYFDLAARYGILGIIIYYNMIKKTILYILRLSPNQGITNSLVIVVICMVLYSFINNLTNQACLMVMLFLFLPITLQLFKYRKL